MHLFKNKFSEYAQNFEFLPNYVLEVFHYWVTGIIFDTTKTTNEFALIEKQSRDKFYILSFAPNYLVVYFNYDTTKNNQPHTLESL